MYWSTFLLVALSAVSLASASSCIWTFEDGVREGVTFSGTLVPKWDTNACSASYMSYNVLAAPAGFAMDSLRSPSFKFTPAYGTAGLVRVNLKITCKIFTPVCDSAAIFFMIAPGATTSTASSTTHVTMPGITTAGQTSLPTSSAPTSSTPTIASSMPTAATSINISSTTATTATPNMNQTTFTTTLTNTTAATTTPTTTPLPFMGACPANPRTANVSVSKSYTVDFGLISSDANKNAFGITSCPQQLTISLLPSTATVTGNTQPPNVSPSALWTTVGFGNTNLLFDAIGANVIEGIFSISFNVLCGGAPLCNATQSIVVSHNLTSPPISTVPACNGVYGYTGYFGFGSNHSVTGIEGETQCPDSTPLRTIVGITKPQANPGNFSFNSATGSFYYLPPTVPMVDSFILGIQCNGVLYCQATALIVTEGATPYIPTQSMLSTTTEPTLEACPNVYQFPFSIPQPSTTVTFSLRGLAGEKQCSGTSYYRIVSQPAKGGTILFSNPNTGAITYLTPDSLAVTLDFFTIVVGCSGDAAWECQATVYVLITEGTPAPTAPSTTSPRDVYQISDQLTCSGSCDADDILKVSEGFPSLFDVNNTLGPVAGRSRADKKTIGSAYFEVTRHGTLSIKVYGKIANMMSGRFPTFTPLTPDRQYTAATVPAGTESAVAFNASCLSRQVKSGVAEELWQWTNLSNYEGKTVGNYASSDNIYQKFGGKHLNCDTFRVDSCKYAPTLTPASVKNIFVGEYNLSNVKPSTPPNVDWRTYIRWRLNIQGCDTTWETELTPRQIRSLSAAVNQTSERAKFFTRISDRILTGNLYSQSVKPIRWHPPFTGVSSVTSANPIAIATGNALEVDSTQIGYLPDLVAYITSRLQGGGQTTSTQTTTVAPVATNTTTATSSPTNQTALSTNATTRLNTTSINQTMTNIAITTMTPPPTLTATTKIVTAPSEGIPNVTISTDIQYFSGANEKSERTYGYNFLLMPTGTNIDFGKLFVADVSVQLSDFSTPSKANCPRCAGTNATCEARNVSKALFEPLSIFNSTCMNATTGADSSIVSLFAGPKITGMCPEINATSPAAKLAPLVMGVSDTTCPQHYFNVTLRGIVRGTQTTSDVGQPEAIIVLKVTLSNGQVFQTTLQQHVFLAQVAASPSDLLLTTACRSSAYFPVKDPFGPSSSTHRLEYSAVSEPSIHGTTHHSAPCPDAATLTAAATSVNKGAAENATLRLSGDNGDAMCVSENAVLSPTDWHFFQIETNDTLDYLVLTVAAAEVVPNAGAQTFSFMLAHSVHPNIPASLNNALPWKRYAAMLNFRQFATTVNPLTNTKILSFAFIPGTLLRPGSSAHVPFTLEASLLTPQGQLVYLRSVIQVSVQMSRKTDGRDMYDLGIHTSFGDANEEAAHTALLLAIILCGGAVVVILVAVYFDDTAKGVVLDQHAIIMELVTGKKSERIQRRGTATRPTVPHHNTAGDPFTNSPNTVPTRFVDNSSRGPTVRQPRPPIHNEPTRVRHFDLEVEVEPPRRHDSEERESYSS